MNVGEAEKEVSVMTAERGRGRKWEIAGEVREKDIERGKWEMEKE